MESYHIVLLSVPALSHVRQMLSLATRLALEREDIVLTIFLSADTLDKGLADVQYLADSDKPALMSAAKRMRILSTFAPSPADNLFTSMAKSADTYASYLSQLLSSTPTSITCASKGTTFPYVPAPCAAILSFVAMREIQATRSVSAASGVYGDGVGMPVIAMNFTPAAPFVRLFGAEGMGGLGDLGARVDAEVERTGKDAAEVGMEMYYRAVGDVINVPGLPAMYDYEAFPQASPKGPMATFLRACYASIQESEALVLTTCKAYENSGSLDALRAYRAEGGKKTFALGPLFPLQYAYGGEHTEQPQKKSGDDALDKFLEDKLARFGENSVLFISFGTMNWPESLDNLEEIINCLIEKEMPFILCHASPAANIPEALIAKVAASGLGYLSKWVPQHYVLHHPATGWYLTHCGWGGVVESLGAGVPMICWPFANDQPYTAAHLSENLKVGIELVEVRTGECASSADKFRPFHRSGKAAKGTREAVREEFVGVVEALRGEMGKELRVNTQRLKDEFENAWAEDGDARAEVRNLLNEFVLKK